MKVVIYSSIEFMIMKNIYALFLILFFAGFGLVNAQTGPGGIGNKDGSNGQPENVLWLRADDLSLSGGTSVSAWPDSSGNGNDLRSSDNTNIGDPVFTLNQVNSLPVVTFSHSVGVHGTSLIYNPVNSFISSEVTAIIIYHTEEANEGVISYASSASDNDYLLYNSSNLATYIRGSNQSSSYDLKSSSYQIVTHKWRNSNGELHLIQNGTDVYSRTGFRTGISITGNGCLVIGHEQDGIDYYGSNGQAFDGDIAEVIMFATYLNDAQRTIVENYLQNKYGIAISNDVFASGDASYNDNLTGVGQESDGSQLESASVGFYVNADVASLNPGDYIMFAHNNTTNTRSTADLPSGTEARWARDWYVEKTGTQNATLIFDLPEGISGGKYPQNIFNYVLLYRSGTSGTYSIVSGVSAAIGEADQVSFDITDTDLSNGYYTLGTTDQTNSPVEGEAGRTWYTLISGDWNDWNTWTLDPSGALPNNPSHEYPQDVSESVIIKSGKTVTMNLNNLHCASLKVDGRLDLGTTTGHTFDVISGTGRMLMAADNFPSYVDYSAFVDEGEDEGTVVYYGSSSYSLNTSYTFFNMEIDMNAGQTVTLLKDYVINGYFTINKGTFQINDNTATTNLDLTVKGDVYVETTGLIHTGSANARHQFNFYGDFTNKGEVKFTNRSSAAYSSEATDGIVDANFLSSTTDQNISCEGTTNFYRIEIDKGSDATYILNIDASNSSYFNLFGYANQSHGGVTQLTDNANALGLIMGTVRIGSNINVPVLSYTASNYNISAGAKLWVDGGTVQKNSGNAIVPYGTVEVSDGLLESKINSGITTRNNGLIKVSGGIVNTRVIRTSVDGVSVGGYIQSDGEVNVVSTGTADYYHFCLTYPGNTFSMTGGILHVYNSTGSGNNQGGIFIASDPENVNVTGGTIIAEIQSTTNPFIINSKAPFYNLILRNTLNSTTDHILDDASNVGSTNENQTAQPLVVLNDLTIEDNCFLNHNGENIAIGGDFSIAENSQKQGTNNYGLLYDSGKPNTLTFNGTGSDTLYIGHDVDDGYELHVNNLTVNKSIGSEIVLRGDPNKDPTLTSLTKEYNNKLLLIKNTTDINSGTLNQRHQSIRTYGPVIISKNGVFGVYEAGTTPLTAYIMLKDGTDIDSEDGAEIGNMKLNPQDGKYVYLSNDVHIKRIGYYNGSLNLRTYNAKVDYLHKKSTITNVASSFCATDRMIFSDANASDGGLSILITGNGTYTFPLGTETTTTRYTYAELTVSNFVDSGYVTIRPVDGELKTTDLSGDDLLSYYWRVGYEGFANLPGVKYVFKYSGSDIEAGDNENNYYPGKVLDGDGYIRSYEQKSNIVKNKNLIKFNDTGGTSGNTGSGFILEKANYTAGATNRFSGTVKKYYTHNTSGNRDWNVTGNWDVDTPGSTTHALPTDGSIVFIRTSCRVNIKDYNIADVAEVNFTFDPAVDGDATTESVPRLQFWKGRTYNIGKVSGVGMVSLNNGGGPTVNADWGEFANNEYSYLMYWGGNVTHTDIIQPCPSLMMEGSTQKINQDITINNDMILQSSTNFTPLQDMLIKRNLYTGAYSGGTMHFPESGSPVTVTVEGDVDYSYLRTSTPRRIIVDNSGNSIEHKLIVKGDINQGSNNSYTLDLFSVQGQTNVILELAGDESGEYYRTSTSVPDLYRVVMNKGSNQDTTFTFSDSFSLNGVTSGVGVVKAIELQSGILVLDDAAINIDLTTGDDDFEIPSTASLEVKQGTVNASGGSGILLDGKLKVSGGTVDMSGGDNYIRYFASGSATIEVTGGTLKVGSQIRRGTTSTEGMLTYIQSGGSVEVGADAAGTASRGIFEILNAGSSFTHSGGSFTLINDLRSNPTSASMYFDPETVSLGTGTTITFGNMSTTSGDFTLYAGETLENITINHSGTNLTLSVVPCTINEDLNIDTGTTFDANGLVLNMKGDFINSGTFTASGNNTYFSGTLDQTITGATEFYNLYKDQSNKLTLADDITVTRELHLGFGTFDDGGNDLFAQGDMYIDITTTSGALNDGIIASGTSRQNLYGNPVLAKFKTDNISGISVPTGNVITITDELKLSKGIFDIGQNLMTLTKDADIIETSPFSETNMVQTNISFTDAGIKKYFPVISSATTFVYPMGSGGKYTPVTLNISNSATDNTYVRVKAANEIHPSITTTNGDPDNVLKYYWILDASNASGFTGEAVMQAYSGDVQLTGLNTAADYITARLLSRSSGNWDKYLTSDFEEGTSKLTFTFTNTDDVGIDGDYTAGVDVAIPDQVALYTSTKDGDWTDQTVWSPQSPAGGPRGARVLIKHAVTTPSNYIMSYASEIDNGGKLNVNSTYGHRLGNVSGNGTLYMERGDIPAGDYTDFFAATGGTVEYGGTTNYDILSEMPEVNNIIVSGTGDRRLPNIEVQLLGDLTINGPDLINEQVQKLDIKKDINYTSGSYTSKTGLNAIVNMNGSSRQSINGPGSFTGTNSFYNFEINNASGITLNTDIEIDNNMTFGTGVIFSSSTNTITITNTSNTCVTGGKNTSYVEGPLRKAINNSDYFVFPIGDALRYGEIRADVDGSSGGIWEAEYYNHSPGDDSMDPATIDGSGNLAYVSHGEYWRVEAPATTNTANLTMRWDSNSGVNPNSDFTVARWKDLATDAWSEVSTGTVSGTSSSGTTNLLSNLTFGFNGSDNSHYITFGTITIPAYSWLGTTSDWFTASNWGGGVLPDASSNITIAVVANNPVISNSVIAQVNDLTIESGATLTLESGARMTVNGDLVTNDGLTIENSVASPTSLINLGSVTGDVTVEWTYPDNRYMYVGHSVDGVKFSDYSSTFTTPGTDLWLYRWPNSWTRITTDVSGSNGLSGTEMDKLEGYAVKSKEGTSTQVISYSGALHYGTYSSTYDGYKLIANPYQAYIDMEDLVSNIGTADPSVWTSTNVSGELAYATYNISSNAGVNGGTRYIAPGQSFWIEHTANSTLTISPSLRTFNDRTALKGVPLSQDNELRLTMNSDGLSDEILLLFRPEGTVNEVIEYDSKKRMGSAEYIPNIYALKGAEKVVIGAYPEAGMIDTVKLGYKFSQVKEISLRATNINQFGAMDNVYLFDKLTDVEVNLRDTPEYTFTSTAGEDADRFEIYFTHVATAIDDIDNGSAIGDGINIYGTGQKGFVKVTEDILANSKGKGIIRLFNASGRMLKEFNLTDIKTTIDLPEAYGVYVITVSTDDMVVTGKVTRVK